MKKWQVNSEITLQNSKITIETIINQLLLNRGITVENTASFLNPPHPNTLTTQDVGIDENELQKALKRIHVAIQNKESIVVYADYDADGITAGAIMWEAVHSLGGAIMPYIPHRVEEGYGFSLKGIEAVKKLHNPTLIISVDHGITAREKIAYAQSLGIDVIVTDHHVKPEKLPECTAIVHTTQLCGAEISWFVARELVNGSQQDELLALAGIGTIADMVPLCGPSRAIAKYGLVALNHTQRVGLTALISDAGLTLGEIRTYEVSHILAPRLNAMGRLVHGLDALRLLCTKDPEKAALLAQLLGLTNRDRQQMTDTFALHAKDVVEARIKKQELPKLLFVFDESYNQGVIGLVAGKLVEKYYRPAIVIAKGETYSKASARSINGFNIIEAIRSCSDLLVDAGGHPMAAGFTVETSKLALLQQKLESVAEQSLTEELLIRQLHIDLRLPLEIISENLWSALQQLAPFGIGNYEPLFATENVTVADARVIGRDSKHLKFKVRTDRGLIDAIGFGFGEVLSQLTPTKAVNIAYTVDINEWQGKRNLQLKIKDIDISN